MLVALYKKSIIASVTKFRNIWSKNWKRSDQLPQK